MDKSIIKRTIMTLITLLVIAYVIYVVCSAGFSRIKTETANRITVSDSITVPGYFIRDEKLITYKGNGIVSYTANDGGKVSKNETVANIFATSEDANAKKEIEELQAQIDSLKQLEKTSDTITMTPDEIDNNINSYLIQTNINTSNDDYTLADENIKDILYNMNERQLVTGKLTDFTKKINELQSQIDDLKKNVSGYKKNSAVKSPVAGYFVSSADGYENIYTSSDIENIYPKDLVQDKIKPVQVPENVIGKTIEGVYWYVAVSVTPEQVLALKSSDNITIELPLASNENIDVSLVSINQETKDSNAVAVFRSDYMTSKMANMRYESIVININTYSGIYIPKQAVHECEFTSTVMDANGKEKEVTETVTGVYVQLGNMLSFRQIITAYSGDDYVICKVSPDDDDIFYSDVDLLKVYDDIVVEGADLYDGKLVN